MFILRRFVLIGMLASIVAQGTSADADEGRRPKDDAELKSWLENMIWHHRFEPAEIAAAAGMSIDEVEAAAKRLNINASNKPALAKDAPLLVLPYPGGRHPRIGFLDGAVDPQRETKVSVFCPWDDSSYVVADVPEAIWSNLGLTYLAHTHVDTVWTKQGIKLPKLEWERTASGGCRMARTLPNGIAFETKVLPEKEGVRFEMSLTNGTNAPLSDMRVQNCVMLKGAKGFEQQTNDNKVLAAPYCAVRNPTGDKWIITAWSPIHRAWANPPCPCLHADPKFPDCAPGQTVRVRGWLSFYEGTDIKKEFERLNTIDWQGD